MGTAKEQFSGFYSSATQPVFVFDEQGQPIYRNEAATMMMARLHLASETELRTATVEREWAQCAKYIRGASAMVRFGDEVLVLHILPQYCQSELYMVIRSEERMMMPEEQKMMALVQTSGSKLRSYLNSIYGVAQLIGKDEGRGYELADAVRRILRMNNHFYQLMDGSADHRYLVPMNISRFIGSFGRTVSEVNPDIPLYIMPTSPDLYVAVMPEDLELVLSNLISNAYRFGAARIALRAERVGKRIDLTVTDDGVGVKEPDRLFEWGYRTRDVKGEMGLGYALAVVKKLLEQQGAVITHSRENGLTCFTVSFEEITVSPGTRLAEWKPEPMENSLSQLRVELSDIL